jgi:hypothetical protein
MPDKLQGKRIAFLVAPEGTEQVELTQPWEAVSGEGATAELVSTETGEAQAFNHLDKADTFKVDRTVGDVTAADYDGSCMRSKTGLATSGQHEHGEVRSCAASSSRPSRSA